MGSVISANCIRPHEMAIISVSSDLCDLAKSLRGQIHR